MKSRNKRKRNSFIRHAMLTLIFICISLTYVTNNFRTDISSWKRVYNRTISSENNDISHQYALSSADKNQLQNHKYMSNSESVPNCTTNSSNPSTVTLTRKLPRAIIIGVKKCGTRALLEYLRLHPDIQATGPEPHFFDRYYHMGLDWYRQKMPKSRDGQLTIEKTPRYFVTEEAPQRIYNMSHNIKLILVVRNPITRAISDFTQALSKGEYNMTVTFRSRALRHSGDVNIKWSALNIGLYAFHLKRWLAHFPMESIHIVDGENLIKNPIQELNVVQDFLKLERKIPREIIYMNATRGFPCILKEHKAPPFRCFRSSKGRQHSYADKTTLTLLGGFYEPYNRDFYKMTGRRFNW